MPNQTTIIIIAVAAVVLFLFLIIVGVVAFMLIKKKKAKQKAAEQNAATPGELLQSQSSAPELQASQSWPEPQLEQAAWSPTNQHAADGTGYSDYSYGQETSVSASQQFAEQVYGSDPMPQPQQPSPFDQPTHLPFEPPAQQSPFASPQPPLSSSPPPTSQSPQHSPFESYGTPTTHATPVAPTPLGQKPDEQPFDAGITMDLSAYKRILEEQSKPFVPGLIVFTSGALQGQKFEIPADGLYIGRDSGSAQVVIADPRVSKRHLWIGPQDRKVILMDQESRNGTFLNDTASPRITQTELQNGDIIILGEASVAQFEYRAQE